MIQLTVTGDPVEEMEIRVEIGESTYDNTTNTRGKGMMMIFNSGLWDDGMMPADSQERVSVSGHGSKGLDTFPVRR